MDQEIKDSADPLSGDLTAASDHNAEGDKSDGLEIEAGKGDALLGNPEDGQEDTPVRDFTACEVAKLRTFFFEKLTARHLLNLISALEESNGDDSSGNNGDAVEFKHPTRRQIRYRERINKPILRPISSLKGYRPPPPPSDRRYALSLLSISNFSIETPGAASRNINCIKICKGTSRLLYDTNFLLGEDWCSCVISVHLNKIEAISSTRLDLTLDLKQPAIVEAGYRNGVSTTLTGPCGEIENSLRHKLVMRSLSDMIGFKAALMDTDPSLAQKFTGAKFNHDPGVQHDQLGQQPVISGTPAPFRQQVNSVSLASNGTSHYMVPQLCPNSYGRIGGDLFAQNPRFPPSMQYDLNQFSHGPPTFKYPTEPGNGGRLMCAKLEPMDTHGVVDSVNSMYTHESLFRESQYANAQPEPVPAANSEYYVQAMQSNSDYFINSTITWMDEPSTTTLPQDHGSCPPRSSILEMPLLGVGDTSLLEHGSREGGHNWGAGASHLGFFDTPSV